MAVLADSVALVGQVKVTEAAEEARAPLAAVAAAVAAAVGPWPFVPEPESLSQERSMPTEAVVPTAPPVGLPRPVRTQVECSETVLGVAVVARGVAERGLAEAEAPAEPYSFKVREWISCGRAPSHARAVAVVAAPSDSQVGGAVLVSKVEQMADEVVMGVGADMEVTGERVGFMSRRPPSKTKDKSMAFSSLRSGHPTPFCPTI